MKTHRTILLTLLLLFTTLCVKGQMFYNLTAEEVRIGDQLPVFSYSRDLGRAYADSTYEAEIEYPEFIDMSADDIQRYLSITKNALPALPQPSVNIGVERKHGRLEVSFVPLVFRDGKYQILASFMLKIKSRPVKLRMAAVKTHTASADNTRYAAHSKLASGRWAKIRVPSTGIFCITPELARKAGFTDFSKVKLYGYGGALQDEQIKGDYLEATDDIKEVATYETASGRLFYAQGPVSWKKNDNGRYRRIRNYCSDYGYYFLTESDDAPLTVDSAAFVSAFYPSADFKCSLYENDDFAWYQGGRNLYDSHAISTGQSYEVEVPAKHSPSKAGAASGMITVVVVAKGSGSVSVALNGKEIGTLTMPALGEGDKGSTRTFQVQTTDILATNRVKITNTTGNDDIYLDYVSIQVDDQYMAEVPQLSYMQSAPQPEYVYNITNQDHHADTQVDMVIIIPTSQKLLKEAQRIQKLHEEKDGMRVRIVPADELYNEYSSGTPDVNAYRRYMKMLYDRAGDNEADMPRHLLLFGDCVWDNRLRTPDTRNLSADDLLLCFESENSLNDIYSFVDDGYFAMLDDNEGKAHSGTGLTYTDKIDLSVGRFPVRNTSEAKIMVDKTISYIENKNAGSWQNTLMFIGDDGNNTSSSYEGNIHMQDADNAAKQVENYDAAYDVKRVMSDAYKRESSSTGYSYPDVTKAIMRQQEAGALMINYSGHGEPTGLSHEYIIRLNDLAQATNENLPLWVTAACDILPFDGTVDNIGEATVLNPKGGAVAFFGTTRTVYQSDNARINQAFMRHVMKNSDGKRTTIGEAQMKAKNEMIAGGGDTSQNKLQYSLLGDPALALNTPLLKAVVDSFDNKKPDPDNPVKLLTGSIVTIHGHIEGNGVTNEAFTGLVNIMVRDSKELVTCRKNDPALEEAFQFYDRSKTLYNGTDSVKNGKFSITFAIPQDINYSDKTGLVNIFAVDKGQGLTAHGYNEDFIAVGGEAIANDSIGPSVFCYLNSNTFIDGGNVNTTPYFVAEIKDKDGINAAGTGIGHDMQLVVDGKMQMTYNLNDNFTYYFGSYTSGYTYYTLPELEPGKHQLRFRAWDLLNNSTTTTLTFNVVKGLPTSLINVTCTKNPAREGTTFVLTHDRSGSQIDVKIEVFDLSGRMLWQHSESGTAGLGTYTVNWDLCTDSGARIDTGVYLYRATVSEGGKDKSSKAKKLIVI